MRNSEPSGRLSVPGLWPFSGPLDAVRQTLCPAGPLIGGGLSARLLSVDRITESTSAAATSDVSDMLAVGLTGRAPLSL